MFFATVNISSTCFLSIGIMQSRKNLRAFKNPKVSLRAADSGMLTSFGSLQRRRSNALDRLRQRKGLPGREHKMLKIMYMAVGQNLRYLFCRDYHLFKRLLRVTGGTGF